MKSITHDPEITIFLNEEYKTF